MVNKNTLSTIAVILGVIIVIGGFLVKFVESFKHFGFLSLIILFAGVLLIFGLMFLYDYIKSEN